MIVYQLTEADKKKLLDALLLQKYQDIREKHNVPTELRVIFEAMAEDMHRRFHYHVSVALS